MRQLEQKLEEPKQIEGPVEPAVVEAPMFGLAATDKRFSYSATVNRAIRDYHAGKIYADLTHQAAEDQLDREAFSRANVISRTGIEESAKYNLRAQRRDWRTNEQQHRFGSQRQLADFAIGRYAA